MNKQSNNQRTRKAYLISPGNGVWQVGKTAYCLPTNAAFDVNSRPRSYHLALDVPYNFRGWSAVHYANQLYKEILNNE